MPSPEPSPRVSAATRAHQVHRVLKDHGPLRRSAIAARLEVSDRTVQRALTYLERHHGAPIRRDPSRGISYSDEAFELPAELPDADAMALLLVRQVVERYRGTPLGSRAVAAIDRLVASLSEDQRASAAWVLERVVFSGRPPSPISDSIWNPVLEALHSRRALRLRYKKPGEEPWERRFSPYGLIVRDGDWFLYGRLEGAEEERTLYLPRVQGAEVTPWGFEPPSGFDLARYTGDGFGGLQRDGEPTYLVELRFAAGATAEMALERPWHEKQEVERRSDGCVVVSFPATYLEGVRREIAAWAGVEMSFREERCDDG